jgi:large repetitive protein
LTFAVAGALSISIPLSSAPATDVGEAVKFSTQVSGGASPYTITWSGLPTGCKTTSGTSPTYSCTPTGTGPSSVLVKVVDLNGETATNSTLSFYTYADPTATTPVANLSYIYTDHNVTFSTLVNDGAGPYALVSDVRWWGFSNIPGCTWVSTPTVNVSSVSCTPDHTTNGSVGVYVEITDANGFHAYSKNLTVEVLPQLAPPKPSASLDKADLGMSVTFSVNSSDLGGSPPYSYAWSFGNLSGCASADQPTVTCTPTAVADYWVNVTVQTVDGPPILVATSPNLTGEIFEPLTLGSSPVPKGCDRDRPLSSCVAPEADVGQTLNFTAATSEQGGPLYSGGVPPYSWVWYGLASAGCDSTAIEEPVCGNLTAGVLTVSVTITDAVGASVTSLALNVTIYSDPSVPVPSVTSPSVDAGQTVAFSVSGSVTGGLLPYLNYTWHGLPGSCSDSYNSTDFCQPTKAGTYYISVSVTDSNGFSEPSNSVTLTVYSDQDLTLRSSAGRSLVNQTVTFYATVTRGSGGYTYAWSGLPAGCASANTATLSCVFTTLGKYQVTVLVNDSDGASVNRSISLSVVSSIPPKSILTTPLILGAIIAAAAAGLLVFFYLRSTQLRHRVEQRKKGAAPMPGSRPSTPVRPSTGKGPAPSPKQSETPVRQGPQ